MTFDERMMALALAEARKGRGATSPNPMVGAVVVRGGRVVSKGHHARAGGPHAEVVALSRAEGDAAGATLYVTLEPCHHHGRTPPCTQAVLEAGIQRVVVGAPDPNPGVAGGGARHLAGRGLDVTSGVLEDRCRELNRYWNHFITTGRPYVVMKTAATLDGKIAAHTGASKWITGDKARRLVHRLRDEMDAVLVGRKTVEADDPSLNTRLPGRRRTHDPVRVVVDTHLNAPTRARVFDPGTGGPTVVYCGPDPDPARRAEREQLGVEVRPVPLTDGRVSLADAIDDLGRRRTVSLLIEGGSEINAAAVSADLVDRFMMFYAPKIVGGRDAPTMVGGRGADTIDLGAALELIRIRRVGDDVLIEAAPQRVIPPVVAAETNV
jgi:diaminohydroxyphosphoribosylaminopyrimidine deaminase/5-amino-6-(5-phosphoribosylamino)uracil reductase